jgi:hypothetical protein
MNAYGEAIDAHSFILRMNVAPTVVGAVHCCEFSLPIACNRLVSTLGAYEVKTRFSKCA